MGNAVETIVEAVFTKDKDTGKKIRYTSPADSGQPVTGSIYFDKTPELPQSVTVVVKL